VYVPEFFNVDSPPTPCSRDQREALTAFSKATGQASVIVPDIAAAAGYGECDDFEATSDLEVARDGSAIFASLPLTGLSRIRPTPLLISPDIGTTFDGYFQVHPDGSIIFVNTSDSISTGSLNIYKISPDQAVAGVQRLAELTPCVVQVPNNCVHIPQDGSRATSCPTQETLDNCGRLQNSGQHVPPECINNIGQTQLGLSSSFAVGRAAAGSSDGAPCCRRGCSRACRRRRRTRGSASRTASQPRSGWGWIASGCSGGVADGRRRREDERPLAAPRCPRLDRRAARGTDRARSRA